ncbi:MAG: aspartate aminotransferase family protein [Bacteroidetes bacterium]|nr:aspartate aminotransferase family protein [Bacteroidota bacterium]MDE2671950.1 aspartate aminotransferase family protein [Bacteroidota bacterium]
MDYAQGERTAVSSADGMLTEGDLNVSRRRSRWMAEHIDGPTRTLIEQDAQYFLHQSLSTPCLNVLRACEGASIEDWESRSILDFHGNAVHQVGYRHPSVIKAVIQQLETLPFCPRRYTNEPAIALAGKLAELAPGTLGKVLFAPGGALAMGMAMKLARMATGRFKTISMWDSFHGASLDTISIGGEALFRQDIGPLLPGTHHVPPPNTADCPFDCGDACSLKCADYLDYVLDKEGDIGAVIAETVRSTPFFPPREYWQKVRAACDRHGALLILDEIPHALGRTGRFFTCEHYDMEPDMIVIGKGLGGGIFPLAALIAREQLDIAGDRALGHYTHEKSPVGCAAALATISVIEEEGLLKHVRELGDWTLGQLRAMQKRQPVIRRVEGMGLIIGVTIGDGRQSVALAEDVMYRALASGLNFKLTMGTTIQLMPALTITQEQMQHALDILEMSIAAAANQVVE